MYMNIKKLYNELVRIGGQQFALEMHRRFGGETAQVANRRSKWYKAMDELLGPTAGDDFYSKYHNRISIYVGKIDRLLSEKRNEKLKSDYKKGVDYRVLARKYNLTAMYVRKIVGHHPIKDRNEKLKLERQKSLVNDVNS